eukprot:g8767.t1
MPIQVEIDGIRTTQHPRGHVLYNISHDPDLAGYDVDPIDLPVVAPVKAQHLVSRPVGGLAGQVCALPDPQATLFLALAACRVQVATGWSETAACQGPSHPNRSSTVAQHGCISRTFLGFKKKFGKIGFKFHLSCAAVISNGMHKIFSNQKCFLNPNV